MKESQVTTLLNALLFGIRIDRVTAWQQFKIADLRSRISDVSRTYGITPERRTKPTKKYKEYWIENKKDFQV